MNIKAGSDMTAGQGCGALTPGCKASCERPAGHPLPHWYDDPEDGVRCVWPADEASPGLLTVEEGRA